MKLQDHDPNANALVLPFFSQWNDRELGKFSTVEFIDFLYRRALAIGEDIYDANAYEIVNIDRSTRIENSFFLSRQTCLG